MGTWLRLNRGSGYNPFNLNGPKCVIRTAWRPRVAKRRRAQMGGRPFEDVLETIPLRIQSKVSDSDALDELARLVEALEQARAWELGATVEPVLLEYLPNEFGSQTTPLKAEVLYTLEVENLLELQPGFDQLLQAYVIDFDLPLKRRGQWLDAEETPAASSSVANPGKMTVTFNNDARLPSPVKLVFGDSPAGTGGAYSQGLILAADQADKILVEDLNLISWTPTGIGWSTLSTGAAARALGGSVVRLTPSTNTTQRILESPTVSSFNANARFIAFFMSLKNNSTTISYTIQVQADTGAGNQVNSRVKVIKENNTLNQLVGLGFVAVPQTPTRWRLLITPSAVGGAGNELDMDVFFVLAVDELTRAISFRNPGSFDDLTLNPQVLLKPQPTLTTVVSSATRYVTQETDLLLYNVATNLTTVLAGVGTGTWRIEDGANNIISFTTTASRRMGFVTPQ